MEQPRPVKAMSLMRPSGSAIATDSSISSPHRGLWPRLANVGVSSRPWLRGFW